MRVQVLSVFAACAVWWIATAGIAQTQGVNVDVNPNGVNVETHRAKQMAHAEGQVVRAKDLTGLSVYNANNESLGKIEDLVIGPRAGKIRYAVLSFGGILGIGDKYFAVPWHKLSFAAKGETGSETQKEHHCVLDVAKDSLKNAPGFDKDNWPNFADANWTATVDQYYGAGRQAGERNSDSVAIVRAKDLSGLSVYNDANESLGKIEDLVIDPVTGKIRYSVLSFGGVLGIGDKYFAIPWRKLAFVSKGETSSGTLKEDHCVLDVPKESLKNAPGFDKDHWPNFADANWNATVDQYYGTRHEAAGERNPQR